MSKENTSALIVPALTPEFSVKISAEHIETRDEYLVEAGFIESFTSVAEVQKATPLVAKMKGWAKEVEAAREATKKPYLNAGRVIDAAAAKAVETLTAEVKRIEKLMGDFQQAQLKKEREERLAREAAEQAERNRLAELQRQQEEAERKAREAAEAAQRALEAAKTKKAQAEAQKLADEANARAAEAEQARDANEDAQIAAQEKEPEVVAPTTKGAKGASFRPTYTFEVTDIEALYEAQPGLVKLAPDVAEINRHINLPGAKHDIPGLKITEVVKVAVRSASRQEAEFLG
jgi:hypothetical protein